MSKPKEQKEPSGYDEPKMALIMSYIRRVDEIEDLIEEGRMYEALRAMCTFMNRLLIPDSETDLLEIRDTLNKNQQHSFLPGSTVQPFWQQINRFMNEGPFADITRAKPQKKDVPKMGE
jgi:hypothetical protein